MTSWKITASQEPAVFSFSFNKLTTTLRTNSHTDICFIKICFRFNSDYMDAFFVFCIIRKPSSSA